MTGVMAIAWFCRMRRQSSKPSPPGIMMSSRNSAGFSRSASEITSAAAGKDTDLETGSFEMVLHQPGNIGFIFHNKDKGLHRLHCIQPRHRPGTADEWISRGCNISSRRSEDVA